MVKLNHPCPKCAAGKMGSGTVRTVGSRRTRYLKCTSCGHREKQIVTLDACGQVINMPDTIHSTLVIPAAIQQL